jgi:hypothetical protein
VTDASACVPAITLAVTGAKDDHGQDQRQHDDDPVAYVDGEAEKLVGHFSGSAGSFPMST